jgi:hypothetical protein
VIVVVTLLFRLDAIPPVWWDEGWTLTVARNWVERGFYGRLLSGEPIQRGLEASFPVTAAVALSFRLFGIGLYQARLVFVVFLLAVLALIFYLASVFYNRRIAFATLAVLLLMSGAADIHPLIMGRQVLGEVPALFCLIAGFVFIVWAGEQQVKYILGAMVFWSLALIIKAQVAPFWFVSIIFAVVLTLMQRRWQSARLFLAVLLGAPLLMFLWQLLISQILAPVSPSVTGLHQVTALAFYRRVRLATLMTILQCGLPTLLGLAWMIRKLFETQFSIKTHLDAVRIAYFVMAGSWFTWYALASVGIPRYLFPPAFLASIYVAKMLDDWTDGFSVSLWLQNAARVLTGLRPSRNHLYAFAAALLVAWSLTKSVATLADVYIVNADNSVADVVRYLNSETPANALIETYESELHFFLNRRIHYPPDQIHVELIRKTAFREPVVINYDPLAADPDYVVIGFINQNWRLYDRYLSDDKFKLVKLFRRYAVYKRIRKGDGS